MKCNASTAASGRINQQSAPADAMALTIASLVAAAPIAPVEGSPESRRGARMKFVEETQLRLPPIVAPPAKSSSSRGSPWVLHMCGQGSKWTTASHAEL